MLAVHILLHVSARGWHVLEDPEAAFLESFQPQVPPYVHFSLDGSYLYPFE